MTHLVRTKTFWGGVAAVATGVGMILAGETAQGVNAVVAGILAIFMRDGVRKAAAGRS